ncbi:MAG: class I SAM-dependent RNA methyltransferase [Planctomycetota bacterium]
MRPPDLTKRALTRVGCAPHTAGVLRAELEALGCDIQEEDPTGIGVGASLIECMPLNLRLRTASHVRWLLARFRCPSPEALYTHASSYPWEGLVPKDSTISIVSTVDTPKINNTLHATRVLKDAVVDRMLKHTGTRPDAGPDRSGVVLALHWVGDRALIYLDTSGRPLSDRGYRKMPHSAPMRETLAAAVLLTMGYDGTTPLINPMCGAGTLAIEGALIATGRAPGLLRSDYALKSTVLDIAEPWQEARSEARKLARKVPPPPIIATDNDPAAINAAKKNAQAAGVDHLITFRVCDFEGTPLPSGPGDVVMNPEYGERLGDTNELRGTYRRIGDWLKQKCAGKTGHIFTASRELAGCVGLRAAKRTPFMNARIECRLLSYPIS